MSRSGRILVNHPGSHHADLPYTNLVAGTTVIRMTKASINTPRANANPSDFVVGSGEKMKLANTEIMMIAADATTFALPVYPSITAVIASLCRDSSRMRDSKKTS